MMREAGIKLRDVPKIQVDDPTEDDHAFVFLETGLRLPLSLWVTEFRQPLQVQSHLEMPRILVQLGHIQRT